MDHSASDDDSFLEDSEKLYPVPDPVEGQLAAKNIVIEHLQNKVTNHYPSKTMSGFDTVGFPVAQTTLLLHSTKDLKLVSHPEHCYFLCILYFYIDATARFIS